MPNPATAKLTYESEVQCPVCQRKFTVTKVRKTALQTDGRDADFNIRYRDLDANLYGVWVCPHCGYASTDQVFDQVSPAERKLLADALGRRPVPECQGVRDDAAGVAAIEQALFCAQARGGKGSALGGLHLRMAWIYRRLGDPREREQLELALANYLKAYSGEPLPIGKMSGATLAYLIGELARRLGRFAEAVQYFQIAVKEGAGSEPQTVHMAREQWELAREEAASASGARPAATAVEASPRPESAAAAPPPAVSPDPAPAVARTTRRTVSATWALYPEQLGWLKKVAAQNGHPLDPGVALRAVLEVAAAIEPADLRGEGEAGIASALRAALRRHE